QSSYSTTNAAFPIERSTRPGILRAAGVSRRWTRTRHSQTHRLGRGKERRCQGGGEYIQNRVRGRGGEERRGNQLAVGVDQWTYSISDWLPTARNLTKPVG